jgi:hypothetical protein
MSWKPPSERYGNESREVTRAPQEGIFHLLGRSAFVTVATLPIPTDGVASLKQKRLPQSLLFLPPCVRVEHELLRTSPLFKPNTLISSL